MRMKATRQVSIIRGLPCELGVLIPAMGLTQDTEVEGFRFVNGGQEKTVSSISWLIWDDVRTIEHWIDFQTQMETMNQGTVGGLPEVSKLEIAARAFQENGRSRG